MADSTKFELDPSAWRASLSRLTGEGRVSLARSAAVAGGEVLRDEARARAPVADGKLRASIYLAFKEAYSTGKSVEYAVSWNSKKAPHGHLLEFGHWQPYRVVKIGDNFVTLPQKLASPRWVPAHPFMRPAYEAKVGEALKAMAERARERFPEILAGTGGNAPAAEPVAQAVDGDGDES